jgi:hypothetical protein
MERGAVTATNMRRAGLAILVASVLPWLVLGLLALGKVLSREQLVLLAGTFGIATELLLWLGTGLMGWDLVAARNGTLKRTTGQWIGAVGVGFRVTTYDAYVLGLEFQALVRRHRMAVGIGLMFFGMPIGAFPEILGWPLHSVVTAMERPFSERVTPIAACMLLMAAWAESQRPHLLTHRRIAAITTSGIEWWALLPAYTFALVVALIPALMLIVPLTVLIESDGSQTLRGLGVALTGVAALTFAHTTSVTTIVAICGLFCALAASAAGQIPLPDTNTLVVAALLVGGLTAGVSWLRRGRLCARSRFIAPLHPAAVGAWATRHAPLLMNEARKLSGDMRAYTLFKMGFGLLIAIATNEVMARIDSPESQWRIAVFGAAVLAVFMLSIGDALAEGDGPARWLIDTSPVALEPRRRVLVLSMLALPVAILFGYGELPVGLSIAATSLLGIVVCAASALSAHYSDTFKLISRIAVMGAWGFFAGSWFN